MSRSARTNSQFDPDKFELIHQVGGIRTATFDWPDAGGSPGCRVAMVNTGSGLRFTVALDRGADIVEAFYQNIALAYLTPNGYKPPSHSLHRDEDWLGSWPGGLVTSCGPRYIGPGRQENGKKVYLHGPLSNTPAALLAIHNPDLRSNDLGMHLEMVIRDTRMYGPAVEVRRRLCCTLGRPVIELQDEVINLGNTTVAHNWLYHVNLGYPLLDRDAQFIYNGTVNGGWEMGPNLAMADLPKGDGDFKRFMKVPDPWPEHTGTASRGLILDVNADPEGIGHIGLVNSNLELGLELAYPTESLPRLANWQHFGPNGAYVSALEPFSGSLFGKEQDNHPLAEQWLEPGQSKRYNLTITVHTELTGINTLLAHLGELIADF